MIAFKHFQCNRLGERVSRMIMSVLHFQLTVTKGFRPELDEVKRNPYTLDNDIDSFSLTSPINIIVTLNSNS